MSLRPGDLLGLPAPDVMAHVVLLRWALVAAALLWALAWLRGRRLLPLVAGVLFLEIALGFWVLALGRPYGVLVDPDATRFAAEVSVAAQTRRFDEGPLVASRAASLDTTLWARLPMKAPVLLMLPTLLPLFVPVALGLLVALAWQRRELTVLGASLWLAFGTGELDAIDGAGFVTGIWSRPVASLAVIAVIAVVLLAGRVPRRGAGFALGLAAALAVLLVPGGPAPTGLSAALRWLSFDQGLWLPLGVWGLVRSRDAAPRALALGGALAILVAAAGTLDAWAGHALYRLGLLLAATEPVAMLASGIGAALAAHPRLAGRALEPRRLGLAVIFASAVPGSFVAWWDPPKLDAVAKASLAPLSPNLLAPMEWIRRQTRPDAVFVADEDYSAAVAALAGRRVLRAPLVGEALDEERRQRAEHALISGREAGPLLARYRVSHVLVAPGDFRAQGLRAPEELDQRPRLRRVYFDAEGLRIYALE